MGVTKGSELMPERLRAVFVFGHAKCGPSLRIWPKPDLDGKTV